MKKHFGFWILTWVVLVSVWFGSPAAAADEAPQTLVAFNLPVLNSYVWRGLQVNEDPVAQPSLTLTHGILSFNLWGNMDLTGYGEKEDAGYGNRSGEFTELDLTLSGGYTFSFISANAGIISYVFPGIAATTHELFLSLKADMAASPTLVLYSDVDEVKGSYFLFSLGQHVALPESVKPLSGAALGFSLGYGSATYNRAYFGVEEAKLVDGNIKLSLPLTLGSFIVTPSALYCILLDGDIQEALDEEGYWVVGLDLGMTL